MKTEWWLRQDDRQGGFEGVKATQIVDRQAVRRFSLALTPAGGGSDVALIGCGRGCYGLATPAGYGSFFA